MAWVKQDVRYWTVCWKWIFPYPCRKTRKRFCCTGTHKEICVGFLAKHWFCCDGRQSSWWSWCFGAGSWLTTGTTACRKEIPSESEGCPKTIGDIPSVIRTELTSVVMGALVLTLVVAGVLTIAESAELTDSTIAASAVIGGTIGATSHRPTAGILLVALELFAFTKYL